MWPGLLHEWSLWIRPSDSVDCQIYNLIGEARRNSRSVSSEAVVILTLHTLLPNKEQSHTWCCAGKYSACKLCGFQINLFPVIFFFLDCWTCFVCSFCIQLSLPFVIWTSLGHLWCHMALIYYSSTLIVSDIIWGHQFDAYMTAKIWGWGCLLCSTVFIQGISFVEKRKRTTDLYF